MTNQTGKVLTEDDLRHFTGTETWYKHGLISRIKYTEGVKYVADKAGAYWLIDVIVSWQLDLKVSAEDFQVWKLIVNDNHNGIVTCEDGNGNEVCRQDINYTDFPLKEIKFYFTDNVIMLPSEY